MKYHWMLLSIMMFNKVYWYPLRQSTFSLLLHLCACSRTVKLKCMVKGSSFLLWFWSWKKNSISNPCSNPVNILAIVVLWISPQTQALHRLYLHFPGLNLQFDFVPMIDKGLFDLATCWFETKMGSVTVERSVDLCFSLEQRLVLKMPEAACTHAWNDTITTST